MSTLSIDIETYSETDLKTAGVYKYTEDPAFRILLIAYAVEDEKVRIIDMTESNNALELFDFKLALQDSIYIKTAFNANFERTCLSTRMGLDLEPDQWRCSAVHAATLGLPRNLDGVAKVLGLPEQKMAAGKALINFFCKPCKPTKANGGRTRNLPHHDPERWELFKEYCKQDVETERAIRKHLQRIERIQRSEHQLWCLDQKINDRGIRIDRQLVGQAIETDEVVAARLTEEAVALTGLNNPGSVSQLKSWLLKAADIEVESLNKAAIPELIKNTDDETVKKVLQLRREMSRTSVKKYQALERAANTDDRIRGTMLFYGARTGRWAGRIFQPQNLPQNKLKDLDFARQLVKAGDPEAIELLFGDIPDTLSQLIRTALIPNEGCRFLVADFSAIEARVIAWLAKEKWRLDVFNTHGKIYEASASQMFKVPIENIVKGRPEYALRQKGKIAELALGYGGAVGALTTMGALNYGLTTEELDPLVKAWRRSNPAITKMWWEIGDAAIAAVADPGATEETHGITFKAENGFLFIRLPSGRRLAYPRPGIEVNRYGRNELMYEGIEQGRKTWGKVSTYGPKLVENIVQAIARDLLADAMINLDAAGYRIVMHVHDEVIIEDPVDHDGALEYIEYVMGQIPAWAAGLPQRADGYECEFYRKE